jgi:replicative DNA helicase
MKNNVIPPYNEEIELALLSGCLLSPDVADTALSILSVEHFYIEAHRTVYSAITKAYEQTGRVDMVTVEGILRSEPHNTRPQLPVTEIISERCSTINTADYHCDLLIEIALRRKAIAELNKLSESAYEMNGYDLLDKVAEIAILSDSDGSTVKSYSPAEILARDKAKQIFLPTGIQLIDAGICAHAGQRKGQVEVTIADSGHGKTHYAMWKAAHLMNHGARVHWFQLEDSDEKTARYFADHCGKNADNAMICDSIDDIEAIKREARIGVKQDATDHIVVDYVQNVTCDRRNRNDQVEYISSQLTKMAKTLNVSVHILSQVTIEYGKRNGWAQEPRPGDVRWSQQLKQDAHLGTSVFRPVMVESLIEGDYIKDWSGNTQPSQSVFIRQWKVRGGERSWNRVHLIHDTTGLMLYGDWTAKNIAYNNRVKFDDEARF